MKENNTYNEELGGKNLPDSLRVNPFLTPKNFFEEQENNILNHIRLERMVGNINESSLENATSVPDKYFENLENSIFARIAEQDLKDKIHEDGFAVPAQYFDDLSQNIESAISEENLKALVPSLDFEVPNGYFESTEEHIFAKIAESNLRDKIGQESGFTVPKPYFEEASAQIEATITLEKWIGQSKKEAFDVPAGYFDHLTDNILAKTTDASKQETKIIALPKRTNWRKYSAAAAIALVVGIGSYFGFQYNDSNQLASTEVNLENVSDEEILNYLAQVSDGEDLIYLSEYASDTNDDNTPLASDIDKEEIEEYLNYML